MDAETRTRTAESCVNFLSSVAEVERHGGGGPHRHTEAHSGELTTWLGGRVQLPRVASALVEVELPQAPRRHAPEDLDRAPSVLESLYRIEIDREIRTLAGGFTDPGVF